jgi:endonuclease/exonuclease/phosphatase family metal-dependent hydrolase
MEDSLKVDTVYCNSTQIKILSWNIGMLPVLDIFKEKDDRAEAIANALLLCDYDIIVFQEAFTTRSRTILYHALHAQYPYAYGPVNGSPFSLKFNSGIWILSKYVLKKKKEIEFSGSAGFDSFARKGAVLLEGQFQYSSFQLIATHLQDDDYPQSIRDQQLTEIFEQLIFPYSDTNIPQIICGDFNTDEKQIENYAGMLTILNAENGVVSGKTKISFDDEANDTFKSNHPRPRLIDYILTRNSNIIQMISRRISVLKFKWGNGAEYLSDHHGIEAVIVFKKGDYISKVYK